MDKTKPLTQINTVSQNIQSGPIRWVVKGVTLLAMVIAFSGCPPERKSVQQPNNGDKGEPASAVKSNPLSSEAEEELTFSGDGLAMVFAIDKKGKMQMFQPKGSKVLPTERAQFPLRAGDIDWMEQFTIFKTSNPKYCRVRGGALHCYVW